MVLAIRCYPSILLLQVGRKEGVRVLKQPWGAKTEVLRFKGWRTTPSDSLGSILPLLKRWWVYEGAVPPGSETVGRIGFFFCFTYAPLLR